MNFCISIRNAVIEISDITAILAYKKMALLCILFFYLSTFNVSLKLQNRTKYGLQNQYFRISNSTF